VIAKPHSLRHQRPRAPVLASFKIAFSSLTNNRLRTTLTMLGVVIGVAAVIVMIAVGAGAQERIAAQIRSLGSNVIGITPGSLTTKSVRLGSKTAANLTEDDATAVRAEIRGIVGVAPQLFTHAHFTVGSANWAGNIHGVTAPYLSVRDWGVADGRELTADDDARAANVILLGDTVRKKLFGDTEPVGTMMRVAGAPFTVVGVLARKGLSVWGEDQDDVVLMPLRTARLQLVGVNLASPRLVHGISIKFANGLSAKQIIAQINDLLRQRHQIRPAEEDTFIVRDLHEVATAEQTAIDALSITLAAIAFVSLMVGGIGIMNIMLVSVTERTREIGLRLAVGARQRDILAQFLVEALTLAAFGGAIGVVVGILASAAVAHMAGWPVVIDLSTGLMAVVVAGLVGVFFGLYPARRAAQLDPIVALSFE
jgi:putative ABC transport system permease protein